MATANSNPTQLNKHDSMSSVSDEKEKKEHVEYNGPLQEVANPELEAAQMAAPLSRTSARSFKLYGIVFVCYMCCMCNGFDSSLMGGINAMRQYLDYFGMEKAGLKTGITFSIYTIGNMVGALVSGPCADRYGRRAGMFIGNCIILIGAVIITTSQNVPQFRAGRFILGLGVPIGTTAAPSFIVEIVPPQWRGVLGGMYNTFWTIGAVIATGMMAGTGKLAGQISWRLPLAFQCVPSFIVVVSAWFLPESPRWLMANGRYEEAEAIIAEYHAGGDAKHPLIQLQMKEFKESIKLDGSDKRWYDFSELVMTKNRRYRTMLALMMSFFGQWSGNGLGAFLPLMFEAAGREGQNDQLILNFVNSITSWIGAITSALFATDRIGRRKLLVFGTFAISGMLAIVLGTTAKFRSDYDKGIASPAMANASIAFIFLYGTVFAFTYTPLQALYVVEVLHTNTRAKGRGVQSFFANVAGFVNLFAIPIALAEIKHWTYAVYVGWCLIEAIAWYIFAVETKGRTLEELDEIFDSPNPVKASLEKRKVAITGDGHVVEVNRVDV